MAKLMRAEGVSFSEISQVLNRPGQEYSRQLVASRHSCWKTDLPDSELTVLMKLDCEEYPIWPGFHDGEAWRSVDASLVNARVLGWMELYDAAKLLP